MGALAPLSFLQTDPADNEQSTAATVGLMNQYIEAAVNHPPVRAAAQEVFGSLPVASPAWRICLAVYGWVPRNIRFRADEAILAYDLSQSPDQELLIPPYLLLQVRQGDCDDFTMLTCALLRIAGLDTRIVTVAADQDEPWRWSHVYPVAILEDGSRLPVDTAAAAQKRGLGMGWEAPQPFRKREW